MTWNRTGDLGRSAVASLGEGRDDGKGGKHRHVPIQDMQITKLLQIKAGGIPKGRFDLRHEEARCQASCTED